MLPSLAPLCLSLVCSVIAVGPYQAPIEGDPGSKTSGVTAPGEPAADPGAQSAHAADPAAQLFLRAQRLIVRPGEEIEDAGVLVLDGKIIAVGAGLVPPEGARVIEGEVVCAGFIDPWSVLGLEAGSVGEQRSTPSTLSADALDRFGSANERLDALRSGIVAVRLQAGSRSRIGGLGALVRTADVAEPVLLADACLNLAVGVTQGSSPMDPFESITDVDRVAATIESGRSYRESWVEYGHDLEAWETMIAEKLAELEKDFKKAKKSRDKEVKEAEEDGKEFKEERYKEDRRPKKPRFNPDEEVMGRVANGEVPLFVEIHRDTELRRLLASTERFDRLRMVVAGGSGALAVADTLAAREIPVLLWPRPQGVSAPQDYRGSNLALAGELQEAGVTVILGSGGQGAAATRDLPLLASLAVGHGLEREAAFSALTLGAARALDMAHRLGSVEFGKDAELLVLDGDPLGSVTKVQYVVSGGAVVVEP